MKKPILNVLWSGLAGLILLSLSSLSCCTQVEQYQRGISIDHSFDRGSMGPYRVIGDSLVRGQTMHWIKKDMLGNQFYWFYFRISGVKGRKMFFEFSNMQGAYRGNYHQIMHGITRPVYSYDNANWDRIMESEYDRETKIFTFSQAFAEDTAWIAYAHPYPMIRGQALIADLKNKAVDLEVIGQSGLGQDIHLLTIPENAQYTPDKKVVLVLALQHAAEDCGGYFTEGILQYLMSEEAKDIREQYIYKIIPMMNPDGLFHGVARYNFNMEDLNAEWDDGITDMENGPAEPEVLAARNWVQGWMEEGGKIDFAADIHAHGQRAGDCAIHIRDERLHLLVEKINRYWPIRTNFKGPNPGKGNCLNFFTDEINTLAVTMELSQSHNGDEKYLDIEDYRLHGGYFVRAIHDFFTVE